MERILSDFERNANVIALEASQVLGTSTAVLDPTGLVVASDQPLIVGERLDARARKRLKVTNSVPMTLAGTAAELAVLGGAAEPVSERLVRELVELLAKQATIQNLPNESELRSRFIVDILRGNAADEERTLRDAEVLGLDLSRPRAVLLIDAASFIIQPSDSDDPTILLRRRAEQVVNTVAAFFGATPNAICAAYIGGGEVVALKPQQVKKPRAGVPTDHEPGNPHSWPNIESLKVAANGLLECLTAETHAEIGIGIGRFHPGISGIADSYQDATAALMIGRHLRGPGRLYCLDTLGPAAFLGIGDYQTKHDLAALVLDGVTDHPELMQTLECFFANDCSPSKTADALFIHRNTLTYRLQSVARLTGLDPRSFEDAVQLRVALLMRALEPQTASGPQRVSDESELESPGDADDHASPRRLSVRMDRPLLRPRRA